MEKETYFLKEKKDKEEKERKIISRRDFIKKTLTGLGALWFASFMKVGEGALGQLKESFFQERAPEKTINKLNYIIEKIGGWSASQLGCRWVDIYDLNNRPEARKKLIKRLDQKPEIKKEVREPIIMENLKEIGLSPEVVQDFLKTLPKSWCKEVSLITYVDKSLEVVLDEISGRKDELVAHHQSKGQAEPSVIYFFRGAKKMSSAENLLPFLIYEYSHANNWRNRRDLTLRQRINLLYEVLKRVESPDRFKYEFIENITRKSKERELIKKAVEYWAAISMYSLMLIKDNLPPKADMKLVFDYIKTTDPDFDFVRAAKKRLEILKQISKVKQKNL